MITISATADSEFIIGAVSGILPMILKASIQ